MKNELQVRASEHVSKLGREGAHVVSTLVGRRGKKGGWQSTTNLCRKCWTCMGKLQHFDSILEFHLNKSG